MLEYKTSLVIQCYSQWYIRVHKNKNCIIYCIAPHIFCIWFIPRIIYFFHLIGSWSSGFSWGFSSQNNDIIGISYEKNITDGKVSWLYGSVGVIGWLLNRKNGHCFEGNETATISTFLNRKENRLRNTEHLWLLKETYIKNVQKKNLNNWNKDIE